MMIKDPQLIPLWNKIQSRERLSIDDGRVLYTSDDLHGLGHMGNWVKEQKTGNRENREQASSGWGHGDS